MLTVGSIARSGAGNCGSGPTPGSAPVTAIPLHAATQTAATRASGIQRANLVTGKVPAGPLCAPAVRNRENEGLFMGMG
jgi:hypothetical protein